MCDTNRLGAELAEQCYSSSDPVFSGHIGVERHGDDVIGGMAGGGQGATPLAGLVDGHHVTHPLGNVLPLHRLQPHLMEREERGDGGITEGQTGSDGVRLFLNSSSGCHICLLYLN